MRTILSLAVISAIGLSATAANAHCDRWHPCYGYGYRHYNNNGSAVAAGVLGLIVGAAIASDHRQPGYEQGQPEVVYAQPRVIYAQPRVAYDQPQVAYNDAPADISVWFLDIPGRPQQIINQDIVAERGYHCQLWHTVFGGDQMHCHQ